MLWLAVFGCLLINQKGYSQMVPEIQFEKFVLPNGLQVILHEDHSTPIVAVNIWYHVGSKNEKRGRTGFAHLFEHMMFQGSQHVPGEYFAPLEKIGASLNGSTTEDRTNYWENVPRNYLELALWMESDRMGFLLPGIDQAKLDNQRDVVKNERRQSVDNQPYGRVYEAILEALYPPEHPYSWPVIGSMEDLSAASLEDVKEFFRMYYAPNNASLCIAGDFDPAEAKRLVKKYFASIPPGPPITRIEKWIPQLTEEKRIHMTDRVSLPRIYMAWHSPALFDDGDAEMEMLASILARGKNSRLYRSLVYEKQIAQDVRAYQDSKEIAGTFEIVVTARPGHPLRELENAIDAELRALLQEGLTQEEVQSAINAWEARFIRRLQSVGGFGGKADMLNMYNTFAGDPGFYREDYRRHLAVTPEGVLNAARKWLQLDRRVVVWVEPLGELKADTAVQIDRSKQPAAGPNPSVKLPEIKTFQLSNGLRVLVAEQHELPLVQFQLVVHTGWAADPEGKPGVSSLTSDLQDEGTEHRTALQIAQELKDIGASLSTRSSFDASEVSLNTLTRHLDKALDIFADVVIHPTFPEDELQRKKKEYLARILQENQQPFTASLKAFLRTLYGKDHPYGQPFTGTGTPESIQKIQRDDLLKFYRNYFKPNNATLIVVGDVHPGKIKKLLEKKLGDWKPGDIPAVRIPEARQLKKTEVYIVDKPGAVQSVIIAGHLGVPRNTPDYYKIQVMNAILGGKFTSRINLNLREDKGYTYGARSMFMFRKAAGPFLVYAPVHTQYTKQSLEEILKELRGIIKDRPVTDEELEDTKNNLILGYPKRFETIGQIAGHLAEMVTYNLPRDTFERFVPEIERITAKDVMEAASRYLHPDRLLIVVVGDRQRIEQGIRELNLGPIRYLTLEE
jgi:zinc protease